MKKNKLLMLSWLVASATTLGSIATLVSCGDKKPVSGGQLSIDEDSKHVSITDGNVDHAFKFISKKKITKDDTITASAVYVDEASHDFDVTFFIDPEETQETNELNVHATLIKDGTYNIPTNSNTKFDIVFQFPNGKEETIKGFDINFKTTEGVLTPTSDLFLTMPKSTNATIDFSLNGTFPDDGEVYAEILDEEYSDSKLKLNLNDAITGKYWELSADKTHLIIKFKLENASSDPDDFAKFNLVLRCASNKTPSNTSVYWEQKFVGESGKKAFTIAYSDNNFGVNPTDLDDSPLNHSAGINYKEFNLYYYQGFAQAKPTVKVTELAEGIEAKVEYGESYIVDEYRALPIKISFSEKNGNALQDQDITFKLEACYSGPDYPEVPTETIPNDGKTIKFCYRSPKLLDNFASLHPSRFTQPGNLQHTDFEAELLDASPAGVRYEYSIVNDDAHSSPNVKASAATTTISIEEGDTTFKFPVNMSSTGTISDSDYAVFDLKVICYKDDEVQWMQQTSGGEKGAFTVTYHDSILIPTFDVDTDWDSNVGEFTFTYNPINMTINNESFNWTKTEYQGVVEESTPTLETTSGIGRVNFKLKASEGTDIPFDSFLTGNISLTATAPKWEGATAEDQYQLGFNWSGITINYKGVIQYEGTKDIVTEPGKNRAELQFDINPEVVPLIGSSLEVMPSSTESDFHWDVDKSKIAFDEETSILTVPVFGVNKDGSVPTGGQYCNDVGLNFVYTIDQKQREKQFTGFNYTFTSLIDEEGAIKSQTTLPGEHQAQYTVHSRVEIPGIQDDNLEIKYDGPHAMFEDEIPVDVHLDDKSENKNIVFEARSITTIQPDLKYTFDIIIEDEYLGIKERVTGFDFMYTDNKVQYTGTKETKESLDRVFSLAPSSDDETKTIETPQLRFQIEDYQTGHDNEYKFTIEQTGTDLAVIMTTTPRFDSVNTFVFQVALQSNEKLEPGQHQAFSIKVEKTVSEKLEWTQTIHGFGIVVSPEKEPTKLQVATKTTIMTDYSGSTQSALKAFPDGKPALPKGTKAGEKRYQLTIKRNDWETLCPDLPVWDTAVWKLGTYEKPEESHVPYLHYSGVKVYVMNNGELIPLIQTDYSHKEDGDWYQSTGGPVSVFNESLKTKYADWTELVFDLYLADDVTVANTDFYITLANR